MGRNKKSIENRSKSESSLNIGARLASEYLTLNSGILPSAESLYVPITFPYI